MKLVSRTFAVGLLFAAGMPAAFADGVQDYYLQRYNSTGFDTPQNAQSFGMAGATLATLSDSGSVLANPAGLGWMKDAEVSGAYSHDKTTGNDINTFEDVKADTNAGHLLGAFPLAPRRGSTPDYGSLGLGWSKVKANGDDSENLDLDGYRLHLAYGADVSEEVAVGYSLSYFHTELLSGDSTEVRMNDGVRQAVGAQYKLDNATLLGLSTAFGFGKYESVREGDDSNFNANTFNITGGVSHQIEEDLTGAFGIDYTAYSNEIGPDSSVWNFRIGGEQKISNMVRVRAGYRYSAIFGRDALLEGGSTKNDKLSGASAGLGLYFDDGIHADYAFEYRHSGDGDWTHLVSLSVPFSICEDT